MDYKKKYLKYKLKYLNAKKTLRGGYFNSLGDAFDSIGNTFNSLTMSSEQLKEAKEKAAAAAAAAAAKEEARNTLDKIRDAKKELDGIGKNVVPYYCAIYVFLKVNHLADEKDPFTAEEKIKDTTTLCNESNFKKDERDDIYGYLEYLKKYLEYLNGNTARPENEKWQRLLYYNYLKYNYWGEGLITEHDISKYPDIKKGWAMEILDIEKNIAKKESFKF